MQSDGSGTPTSAYAYGAWGSLLNSPAIPQPYEYVGRLGYYTHSSGQGAEVSNWLELGMRFYNPVRGRFERQDPFGDGCSWYPYGNDNPMVYADPRGEKASWKHCRNLLHKIWARIETLRKRYLDMYLDKGYLCEQEEGLPVPPDAPEVYGSWEGHQKAYNNWKTHIDKLLEQFNNDLCKNYQDLRIPKFVDAWMRVPAPQYNKRMRPIMEDKPIQEETWKLVPVIFGILLPEAKAVEEGAEGLGSVCLKCAHAF